ncbi:hypothetical protein FB451DRAFT_1392492 [Mycena latifolia]|nr:hypothetical protein FB451DRAFT_1392492 [Mycena latifolia]
MSHVALGVFAVQLDISPVSTHSPRAQMMLAYRYLKIALYYFASSLDNSNDNNRRRSLALRIALASHAGSAPPVAPLVIPPSALGGAPLRAAPLRGRPAGTIRRGRATYVDTPPETPRPRTAQCPKRLLLTAPTLSRPQAPRTHIMHIMMYALPQRLASRICSSSLSDACPAAPPSALAALTSSHPRTILPSPPARAPFFSLQGRPLSTHSIADGSARNAGGIPDSSDTKPPSDRGRCTAGSPTS